MTTREPLQLTPAEEAVILALRALAAERNNPPTPDPLAGLRPASHWIGMFPAAFNTGDMQASGGEDYREWPKRADRIYFTGYAVRACALIGTLAGDLAWVDEAYNLARTGFVTISALPTDTAHRVSLNELLFLRGVSTLIDVLPDGDARRAELAKSGTKVWDYQWAAGGVKRLISQIVTDPLEYALVMRKHYPDRRDQYDELLAWATPKLDARYQMATDAGWIMALDDDPRYQKPADTAHAGRDARFIARALDLGADRWECWLPLMRRTFARVFDRSTLRFSDALDGSGVPVAHNFGALWASLGRWDVDIQRAMQAYAEARVDTYAAPLLAELAWNARALGVPDAQGAGVG